MQMTFLMSILQRVWTCVFQMSVKTVHVVRAKQKSAGRTRHGVHASHFTDPSTDIPHQQGGVVSSAAALRCH